MSTDTRKSLLQDARLNPASEAWFHLSRIYEPLIAGWIVRAGIDGSEVSDIAQEVMQTLATDLGKFEHNGRVGAFRNWLKTITINRCRRYWDSKKRQLPTDGLHHDGNPTKLINDLEDPCSKMSILWDNEHDSYVLEKILQLIRNEFDKRDYEIFLRNTMEGNDAKSVAAEFGVSVGNVYKIKFRILKRLKEFAAGLLDISET